MNGKILLDTNIIIALFNKDAAVWENFSKTEEVFVPSIALGELYYGALKSGRKAENLFRIDELTSGSMVLVCDAQTVKQYGEIKNALRIKGRPLPENDIWIAALTLQ